MDSRNYIKIKKKEIDICNICLQERKLTWDHVPPKGVNLSGGVYTSTLYDKLPTPGDYGKMYQSGIKFRTICQECNNVILGAQDKWLKAFEASVGSNIVDNIDSFPYSLKINVPINRICRSICGHILAAKEFVDECITDARLREYVMNPALSAKKMGIRIFYWIYLYKTTCVVRDVVPARAGSDEFPSGVISFFSSYPFSFIVCLDDADIKGLHDLAEFSTENIDDLVSVDIDMNSAFYNNTREYRHFKWPCNIDDTEHSAHFVMGSKSTFEDSRIGVRN